MIPLRFVNFSKTKVITVIDIARTVRNPVLIPNIKNIKEASSSGLPAEKLNRSIFSGDANLGTLKIALAKNKTNRDIETVLTRF